MASLPPILRHHIEEAQRHTKSNHAAARWLGVSYPRYRQYAKLYGLFDRHTNMKGTGIDKGFSKRASTIPLRDILAGKHPTYSRRKLKNRLIARKKLINQCSLCGFQEARVTDGQVPLILHFKDGDTTHMALDNLSLLCYNCMFLTQGAPSVVYRTQLDKVMHGKSVRLNDLPITTSDYYDREDDPQELRLSEDEKRELLNNL